MIMKVAMVQMRTELSQDESNEKALRMIHQAAQTGVDVVVLPEMFNCPNTRKYINLYGKKGHEETCKLLSQSAKDNHIILVGGSVCEKTEDEKLYNTCFVYDEQGEQIAKYRKTHICDINMPGYHFHESANFAEGKDFVTFETKFGRMGLGICFDLRYAQPFNALAAAGVKVVFLPAQFSSGNGPTHWYPMMRARAMDNQVFMVGCDGCLYEDFPYQSWGHSTVYDPDGAQLVGSDNTEQIVYCDLDLDLVERYRKWMPIFVNHEKDEARFARLMESVKDK